jgi:hypothetical protein
MLEPGRTSVAAMFIAAVLLTPLFFAAAAPPDPPAAPLQLQHLTLGVRALAVADAFILIPDLEHTGGGFGAFGGITTFDRVEARLGVEFRQLDEGLGFCLEKCGHAGVVPPARDVRQQKLVPFVEVRLRLFDVGPVALLAGMTSAVPLGTSLDLNDPLVIGLVHGFTAGVRVRLEDAWAFEAAARWETGMHLVRGVPVEAHSSILIIDASLIYRFPDVR